MTVLRVDVEWRKDDDGLGGTFAFSPRPNITRPGIIQKRAEFPIPLRDGNTVQLLNNNSRSFLLRGVLVVGGDSNYDDLDQKRQELLDGVGNDVGQLHLISNKGQANSKHLFYKGVPVRISFAEQTNSRILDYTIEVLLSDPTEFEV